MNAVSIRSRLWIVLLWAAVPVAASADEPLTRPLTVRLSPYVGKLLTVPVVIGAHTLTFLLDTGGGQTLITPRVATMLGCTPSGRSVGFRMSGERVEFNHCGATRLEVGGRAFALPQLAVWDVSSVLPKELRAPDGVLALDVFEQQPFTLDLAHGVLTLESAVSLRRRTKEARKAKARIATGISGAERTLFLHGVLETPGWFLFDSGNLDLVQAAPHMVAAAGAVPREIGAVTLALDGLPPGTVRVRLRDLIHDGALSEAFLRTWIWTIDLAHGDVWVAPLPLER